MNVLVVYGSETGTTKRKVKAIEKAWGSRAGKKFGSVTVKSGDEAAADFASIKDTYDAIVIGVSSFGDGDPPEGYQLFLAELYKPSKTEGEEVVRKPLEGMQHAVLGFGSTVYETYQNCPRLTDKLLEDVGSRRMLQRLEIDEMAAGGEQKEIDAWEGKLFDLLNKGSPADAKKAPSNKWDEGEFANDSGKCDVDDRDELVLQLQGSSGGGSTMPMIAVLVVVVAVAVGYLYQTGALN